MVTSIACALNRPAFPRLRRGLEQASGAILEQLLLWTSAVIGSSDSNECSQPKAAPESS